MDKKHPTYGHDKDGFMQLIPRTQQYATGCSIHEGQDSAEYWKNRCLQAENKVRRLEKRVSEVLDLLDQATDQNEREIAELEQELSSPPVQHTPSLPSIDDGLNCGLGVSFGPGKESRLYRLSDRDGDLSSGESFAGGEVEIQPGRGFHIGLHWRKK